MNKILKGLRNRMGDVFGCFSRAEEAHAAGKSKEAHGHLITASTDLAEIFDAVVGLRKAIWALRDAARVSSSEEEAAWWPTPKGRTATRAVPTWEGESHEQ